MTTCDVKDVALSDKHRELLPDSAVTFCSLYFTLLTTLLFWFSLNTFISVISTQRL